MAKKEIMTTSQSPASSKDVAYLVVREGSTWRDVFRLTPGQATTIGRAPTNRVVLRDDICSRNHCEIFQSGSHWTLRDVGSRNGTLLNGIQIAGDTQINEGDLIQIGPCDLGFTYDISQPFPSFENQDEFESDTGSAQHVIELDEPAPGADPKIIKRTKKSRFRDSDQTKHPNDRTSRELASLYRLAINMGGAESVKHLADIVIDGLFSGTSADICAVLLLPEVTSDFAQPKDLRVNAYKSKGEHPYQKVSDYLSRVVLEDWEAVLARDISDDSTLASRDSLGKIHAHSVICAPVRAGTQIYGLIHLYSTNPDNALDSDDLEFTLAAADQMAVVLGNIQQKDNLTNELARAENEAVILRKQLEIESHIIGDSLQVKRLREEITKLAPTDATTLVRGESGVGKELVSRAIHFNSDRSSGPFICMNCAALSESLLESELFGHEKGAFTGAVSRKIGKFEQADHGTIFLDEVGEMSLAVQAKFLRVLEGHSFERVGGGTPVQVNVRTVAATNRDLEKAVEEGSFRKDLFFRLNVVTINVPSLNERSSDIPILVNYFLERIALKKGQIPKSLSTDALETLTQYNWPGNVRELQNVIERAVILGSADRITSRDIQLTTLGKTPEHRNAILRNQQSDSYREVSLYALEQEHILSTLERTNWNKTRAASILGIERSTLDRKLKRYKVSRPKS